MLLSQEAVLQLSLAYYKFSQWSLKPRGNCSLFLLLMIEYQKLFNWVCGHKVESTLASLLRSYIWSNNRVLAQCDMTISSVRQVQLLALSIWCLASIPIWSWCWSPCDQGLLAQLILSRRTHLLLWLLKEINFNLIWPIVFEGSLCFRA